MYRINRNLLGGALTLALLLASCGTSDEVVSNGIFTRRKYNKGYHWSPKDIQKDKATAEDKPQIPHSTPTDEASQGAAISVVPSETASEKQVLQRTAPVTEPHTTGPQSKAGSMVETSPKDNRVNSFLMEKTKPEKELETGASIRQGYYVPAASGQHSSDPDRVVIIILCFLIPPLAVYFYEGRWNERCWLNLVLTLLCGLPGIIHALIVVFE